MPRSKTNGDGLLDLRVIEEFDSKILGTGCAVYSDRVQFYSGVEEVAHTETVMVDDIRFVDAVSWSRVPLGTLVVQAGGGRSFEVPMMPVNEAKRAQRLIRDILHSRNGHKKSA